MDYIVLLITTLLNSGIFIVSGMYGKKERFNSYVFSAFTAVGTLIFFMVYNKFRFVYDGYTVALALICAALTVIGMISNINAVKSGSVAITSMIASFSLLLPTAFGIIYWKEEIKAAFIIGIILMCISIVLTNVTKISNEKEVLAKKEITDKKSSVNATWIMFVTLLFITNGVSSIISTYHQKTGGTEFRGEFMLVSTGVALLINGVMAVIKLKEELGLYIKDGLIYGGAYGIMNAGVRLGVMILAANGIINQSVFFPVISVGVLVIVFIASIILFKEKFKPIQYVGVLVGIASIVFLQV